MQRTETTTYAHPSRIDRYRPPWWRWQVAGEIARSERPDTTEDDPYLQAAIRLQTEIERGRRPRMKTPLEDNLLEAHTIYEADDLRRAEIEARIVTGQSNEEIRQCTGTDAAVVEAYAHVFLDIRHCLTATDILQEHLLDGQQFLGFANHELRPFWTLAAMDGGLPMLDHLVQAFRASHRPGDPGTIDTYLRDGVPLPVQSLVASSVLPMTPLGGRLLVLLSLELRLAKGESDPHISRRRFETVRRWMIRCARMVLAGRNLPKAEIEQLAKSIANGQPVRAKSRVASPGVQRPITEAMMAHPHIGSATGRRGGAQHVAPIADIAMSWSQSGRPADRTMRGYRCDRPAGDQAGADHLHPAVDGTPTTGMPVDAGRACVNEATEVVEQHVDP